MTPAEAVFMVMRKVDVGSAAVLLAAFSSICSYSSVAKSGIAAVKGETDLNSYVEASNESDQDGLASFTVPADAKSGDTLHIILEGIDQGGTNPRAYQRVIVTVQ